MCMAPKMPAMPPPPPPVEAPPPPPAPEATARTAKTGEDRTTTGGDAQGRAGLRLKRAGSALGVNTGGSSRGGLNI